METALSLAVFVAIALVAGAVYVWRNRGLKKQAMLMLVLAAVLAINVAIWTLPTPQGETLYGATPE
jgi:hypothetical protein